MHYSLTETKSFESKSDSYVIYLALNCSKSQLAVNLSNESIEVLDSKTLQTITSITRLERLKAIMKYSPLNDNQLIVCTSDSIKIMDLRHNSNKISKEFKVNVLSESDLNLNDYNFNELICFDSNCDYNYLCAGTEVSERDKNSYLYFWDIRRPALVLGTYCESHTNDITDVTFDPKRRNIFATGSSDELINVFDLNESTEDEALMSTLNVESAVDRIHWRPSVENQLICLTQDECIQLWHSEEAEPQLSLSALSPDSGFDYVIDFLPKDDLICVANKNHSIRMFDISVKTTCDTINKCLTNGHKKMVRTVVSDSDNSVVYSGGEDAVICVWNGLQTTDCLAHKTQTKGKTKIRRSDKNRSNPY